MDGLRKLAVIDLVRELRDAGTATVVVTHDMDFAAEAADVVTTMSAGEGAARPRAARAAWPAGSSSSPRWAWRFGCVSVAEAAALLERSSPVAVHA